MGRVLPAGPGVAVRSVAAIEAAIPRCRRCPRLRAWCAEVARVRVRRHASETYWGRPVPGFGDPRARLLIVGLAPAAHGANRTGRLFTGDSSGDWLYEALHRFGFASRPTSSSADDGLTLHDCYIAASARCAPPQNKPTAAELDACRPWLVAELAALTRVRVVVALGRIAHASYQRAIRVPPTPFGHGVEAAMPGGVTLLSSYHPSRQNTNTGRLTRPMWHTVFRRARALASA